MPEMAAMVRDAVRSWKAEQAARARAIEELRRLRRKGIESGPVEDDPAVFARPRRRLAQDVADE